MDSHNLATVMAPNILYQDPKIQGQVDESFLSIEAVHMLLEYNDQMCEVCYATVLKLLICTNGDRSLRTSNLF